MLAACQECQAVWTECLVWAEKWATTLMMRKVKKPTLNPMVKNKKTELTTSTKKPKKIIKKMMRRLNE